MSDKELARRRLAKRLIRDFMPRFAPHGDIVWSSVRDVEPANGVEDWLRHLKLSPACVKELPSMVVRDSELERLWLIEIAAAGRQLTTDRCSSLKARLAKVPEHLLFLNAFKNRREFGRLLADSPWGTVAWSADEPDHFVAFDADAIRRGVRPYEHSAVQ